MLKKIRKIYCPNCGSEKVWKGGTRKTSTGSIQRYVCRVCGSRFCETRLNRPINVANNRRVGAQVIGKNSATSQDWGVRLLETKEKAEKRAAGATIDIKSLIFNFAWWLKKEGYAETTITTRVKLLKILAKRGANLLVPESVKETIARQNWCNRRKINAVDAYTAFLKMTGGTWDPPKYKVAWKLPFIPTEQELDALIAGCGPVTSTFPQLLKETAMRAGEAHRLKWSDIDFTSGTVRVTPEKGSEPRIFKISEKLLNMLSKLKSKSNSEFVFGKSLRARRRLFQKQRATLARKLQNPRLL